MHHQHLSVGLGPKSLALFVAETSGETAPNAVHKPGSVSMRMRRADATVKHKGSGPCSEARVA